MESIFHEKQEGSLCAQHCLNALLQGEYFTAVDLASLARDLDDEELNRMSEGGVNSPEYLKFLEQPSGNMDDSGFFSVQVISRALTLWALELVPFGSEAATGASIDPTFETAFICNYREHWFAVRKLGHQWFNLNSLLVGPELISDTYLAMFLAQLQQEGYSIFVVVGTLPECDADQILQVMTVTQTHRPKLLSELKKESNKASTSSSASSSSPHKVNLNDLQKALEANRQFLEPDDEKSEEEQLEAAIRLSLEGEEESSKPGCSTEVDVDEVRRKRQEYFERQQGQHQQQGGEKLVKETHENSPKDTKCTDFNEDDQICDDFQDFQDDDRTSQEFTIQDTSTEDTKAVSDMTEDEMLQAALELSMREG
ncbi:ataxin-3-like [Glandiceps talaboti]